MENEVSSTFPPGNSHRASLCFIAHLAAFLSRLTHLPTAFKTSSTRRIGADQDKTVTQSSTESGTWREDFGYVVQNKDSGEKKKLACIYLPCQSFRQAQVFRVWSCIKQINAKEMGQKHLRLTMGFPEALSEAKNYPQIQQIRLSTFPYTNISLNPKHYYFKVPAY